jgi:hypothetical protein
MSVHQIEARLHQTLRRRTWRENGQGRSGAVTSFGAESCRKTRENAQTDLWSGYFPWSSARTKLSTASSVSVTTSVAASKLGGSVSKRPRQRKRRERRTVRLLLDSSRFLSCRASRSLGLCCLQYHLSGLQSDPFERALDVAKVGNGRHVFLLGQLAR